MMDLMGLYRLAEDNDIAVDCFELKKREALSVMDSDGTCYNENQLSRNPKAKTVKV